MALGLESFDDLLDPSLLHDSIESYLTFDDSCSWLQDSTLLEDANLNNYGNINATNSSSGDSSPLHSPLSTSDSGHYSTESSEDNMSSSSETVGRHNSPPLSPDSVTQANVNVQYQQQNSEQQGNKRLATMKRPSYDACVPTVPYVVLLDQTKPLVSLEFKKCEPEYKKIKCEPVPLPQIQPRIIPAVPSNHTYNDRELRKIKNREAAQVSRQKRKALMEDLKDDLLAAQREIKQLRGENQLLRQTVSKLMNGNPPSPPCTPYTPCTPSSPPVSPYLSPISSPNKSAMMKTSFVSLAVVMLMFTLNINGFLSMPKNTPNLDKFEVNSAEFHSRHLLSVDYDVSDNEGKTLKGSVDYEVDEGEGFNSTHFNDKINCSKLNMQNQTENLRLVDELESWMNRHEKLGRALKEPYEIGKKSLNSLSKLKYWSKNRKGLQPLKFSELAVNEKENSNLLTDLYGPRTKDNNGPSVVTLKMDSLLGHRYKQLIDALHRRDDTFYLVALQQEYLLLPALSHNSTHRPRMSLIVPTIPFNSSVEARVDHISMMKIECEVTATGRVQLPEDVLTQPLKKPPVPSKNLTSNSTTN